MATQTEMKTNSPGDFKKIEAIAGPQLRGPASELSTRIAVLAAEAEPAAEVDENALREKLKRVLLQVSVLNSQLLPKFDVEDPQDVASLSILMSETRRYISS
jgi:hypothetical protein